MKRLKDYFERIFVINLPYKQGRRKRLVDHLKEVGIADEADLTWFRAISGDWCVPPEYFKAGGGAWGCHQSHSRVVQDAIMDGLENFLVLEDDVFFHRRAPEMLERLMAELPEDWDQLYLGGQHLRQPEPLSGKPFVHRCKNVNRTHAFALNKKAFVPYHKHINHAPDYISHGAWHIDHQLGLAHERGDWNTYGPAWWMAGQDEGSSNISGNRNPRLWWHAEMYSKKLPFLWLPEDLSEDEMMRVRDYVHLGNNLKQDSLQDEGLEKCVGSPGNLHDWLVMIAREAVDMGLLPGIQHPQISLAEVEHAWGRDVFELDAVDLEEMVDYPFNGLFPHVLNGAVEPVASPRGWSAA